MTTKTQASAIRRRYYLLYIARIILLKISKVGLFINLMVFLGLACTIDGPSFDPGITALMGIVNTVFAAINYLVYYLLKEDK